MAPAARNKIYLFLISILLLSNIAMVIFFVLSKDDKKPPRRGPSYMTESLQKDVGFSKEQMTRFEQMADEHRKQMKPMFEDLKHTKEALYKLVTQSPVSDSVLNTLTNQIGEKQKAIDLKIFRHFQSIRQLCTPDQQPKLDSLIQRMARKMIGMPRREKEKADSAIKVRD